MGFEPGEIYRRLREQEAKGDTPSKCPHRQVTQATLYKGMPLEVAYCEECGSVGAGTRPPTIGEWVPPNRQFNDCRHTLHWRFTVHKAGQKIDAVWCEDCGAVGSLDLREWVPPLQQDEHAPAPPLPRETPR